VPVHDPYFIAKRAPAAENADYMPVTDMAAMRAYRLARLKKALSDRDCDAGLFFDPVNIRYATGTRNMAAFTQHNPDRYAFVATNGPVTLFDAYRSSNPQDHLETIDSYRPSRFWYFETKGDRVEEAVEIFAEDIAEVARAAGGTSWRLAVDKIWAPLIEPLTRRGFTLVDGQAVAETARSIKSAEEIACMNASLAACDIGIARMQEALKPGISEIALWTELARTNLELGGEWMETRLLTSGGRINPWYQECSGKLIRPGELVAFDTDMVGPYGYCADVSRTFFCGPGKPSDEQRRLYALAHEQIMHNVELMRPGMTFREIAEKAWPIPDDFIANRYGSIAHGVGLLDEYPDIPHLIDWEETGFDGVLQENMTLCIESYIGEVGGSEGVKLEEQVLVTADGPQILSMYPYEEALL